MLGLRGLMKFWEMAYRWLPCATVYTQVGFLLKTLHSPPQPPKFGGRNTNFRVISPQNWGVRGLV
jgi:hypothetical protein